MQTLADAAPDFLSDLLEYLTGDEIHLLLATGNRILRLKIINNVRSLTLTPGQTEKFPLSALRLPHLRSLSVKGLPYYYLRFENEYTKPLGALESRITSLQLHFRNAARLFSRPGSLSLKQRFPHLTSLDLYCLGTMALMDSFSELPASLTRLTLSTSLNDSFTDVIQCDLDIAQISKLPRSLLTLDLNWKYIVGADNLDAKWFKEVWPPQLTSLSLKYLKRGTSILGHLPPTLEHLDLDFAGVAEGFVVKTSLLPPNLASLTLSEPIMCDKPLPSTLTTLKTFQTHLTTVLRRGYGDPDWKGIDSLPPLLEFHVRGNEPIAYSVLHPFKRVDYVSISRQEELDEMSDWKVEGFPKRVQLDSYKLKLGKTLPKSVKSLSVRHLMSGEEVQLLPERLSQLEVAPVKLELALPPSWTLEQVTQLPRVLRNLNLSFYLIGDGKKLAPISSLALDRLHLRSVAPSQLKIAESWLCDCLPFYLAHFTLSSRHTDDTSRESALDRVSADCLAACKLAEVVPHLQSLTISISFKDDSKMASLFASLPKKLNFFFWSGIYDALEYGAVSMLPQSLQQLIFRLFTLPSDIHTRTIDSEHFKGLPKRLDHLHLELPRSGHSVGLEVLAYLPKTVCVLNIFPPNKGKASEWIKAINVFRSENLSAMREAAQAP